MDTDESKPKDPLTGAILGAAFEVANTLGHGFLEGVYQRALTHELGLLGLLAEREVPFRISYKGKDIGTYIADLVVAREVIVEIKATENQISSPHLSQCLNYLQASGLKKGLVINFGRPRLDFKRIVI